MPDRTFLDWPFFNDAHRTLASDMAAWTAAEINASEEPNDPFKASQKNVRALGEGGWLRYTVPGEHGDGGKRLDVRSLCLIRETLAHASGLADFSFAMQGLGSGPISLFGSGTLKDAYLPRVADGSAIAAFALTERDSGSDVSAIATSGTTEGDHFVIDGEKTWVSNAGIADFYVVFVRTGEAPGSGGLSAFVVDADTRGLDVTERINVMAPHALGSLRFTGCKVPASHRLGAGGAGFKVAMATLDIFRSTVGAAALGFARRALDEATRYARQREVFEKRLADFQMTQQKIADMATEVDASALLVYRAAWAKDTGRDRITREAAMAKMYSTEAAQRIIDNAVQIFGGLGVVAGHPVERLYRDIRPLRIYEGTTEIQKLIIAKETLKGKDE
ncbi:MAG: acyl-CoA dehydrogenase family protein [bacterium]|nr:acyl-CoA dehydrogenase family protein [bacterium]